ncbi:M3 family metallopeptidase [Corynebacterium felinum]|uniref:Peptidyl-dipeptidase Dcp n=1 Tax=Corynebacterium felinum TaxID=131318 RepID=A0ABU2B4H0_9CORY|nr:M3 family metallopeptidase [Corynebacterium felinum]MDF5821417.1 M3 family metallopeptidase [Corynebacterium felinum]MDR7353493.1 peptidyl-dipeptidase Dcp [Corynebacterium felinum]WJY95672.1 Peptidyl-dipeptidase dcp [Corynebacterium felinum]
MTATQTSHKNPFAQPSTLPYLLPPFEQIETAHYLPAFESGMAAHKAEIDAIVTNPEAPTWENTVEALERSGRELARVSAVFFNLQGTDSNEDMEAIAATIAPKLSAHADSTYLNAALYERVKNVEVPADSESQRLHEHLIRQFTRRGAELNDEQKATLGEINERLSVLTEKFNSNLNASTRQLAVSFDEHELAGLSDSRKQTARKDAQALGREGFVIPLDLPTVQAEQAELDVHEARVKLYEASQRRGANNAEVLIEMVQLRAHKAQLLGYDSHADYVIEEETAKTALAVRELLFDLAPAAATNARNEHKLLVEAAHGEVEGADWSYWASKVRSRDYSLDEDALSKYFPLNQVLVDGVFYAAKRLYGIDVVAREDLVGYHDDVQVWEVKDEDGTGIGLFLTDLYGRPTKRGGAWMSSFVDQSELLGTKPVVVNVMGISKPADGSEALLSLDSLTTLFHEFGHGLHGLLSQVRYPTFSGTNVPRDYVEFPSQINENWAFDPAILRNYARHVDTGELIPDELVEAISAARQFGQGFGTSEYLASAIIDLAWHSLSAEEAAQLTAADIEEFEARALAEAGLEVEHLAPRYRSNYFAHIFAGGYSAGYYSYLWAEALDADGFEWFKETGAAGEDSTDEATRAAGQRFRDLVLSRGGADDFTTAFENLRGRAKDVGPLLRRRGLAGAV